jgi:hypothetical protein
MLPFIDFHNHPFRYEHNSIKPYFAFIVPNRSLLVLDSDTGFFRILSPICKSTTAYIFGTAPINLPTKDIVYDLGLYRD